MTPDTNAAPISDDPARGRYCGFKEAGITRTELWALEDKLSAAEAERDALREQVKGYESCITWQTSCASCARGWDTNYDMYCREQALVAERDQARAAEARMRSALTAISRMDAYCCESSKRLNDRVTELVGIARAALTTDETHKTEEGT